MHIPPQRNLYKHHSLSEQMNVHMQHPPPPPPLYGSFKGKKQETFLRGAKFPQHHLEALKTALVW